MSIAYLIFCHDRMDYLRELIRYIYTPDNVYILHCDKKSPKDFHEYLHILQESFHNVHVLDSALLSWGGYSQVSATISGIGAALSQSEHWDHLMILSGQHLPLFSAETISDRLDKGTSYIQARRVVDMPAAGRQDVLHRFAAHYRELPGVGGFSTGRRASDRIFLANLYQGNNWAVLSRNACRLIHHRRNDGFWTPFVDAIMCDETSLATFMATHGAATGLKFENRTLTFVGHPHLSGNRDLIFTEKNFFEAQGRGFLFARKRPNILPHQIQMRLNAGSVISLERMPKLPEIPGKILLPVISTSTLLQELNERLRTSRSSAILEAMPEKLAHRPEIFFRIKNPYAGKNLAVYIVSSDKVHFKICIIYHTQFKGDYTPMSIGPTLGLIVKVRVHGMCFNREIAMLDDNDHGFHEIRTVDDIGNFVAWIQRYNDYTEFVASSL